MADYKWQPITELSEDDRRIDLAGIGSLYEAWQAARRSLEQSGGESFRAYRKRLIRRLSVETGILERLYDLDRGTTEALVAKGFAEELVSRSSTDLEPARLIDVLRDHEAAVQLVVDCVARNRELTKGVVHQLHQVLTRHQDTTSAIDQFGQRFELPLLKGRFKEQPNNPRRPDGSLHEYCPPIHVESEMDNLLRWLKGYSDEDPLIVGAWLHHRFTQIHPYQDGNGRLARTLTTLVLLRCELLPLVLDRDCREEYLEALEQADMGDLTALARLFARLERSAILEALSVDVDAEVARERTLTDAVIESLAAKFDRRRRTQDAELRRVDSLAQELRSLAHDLIEQAFRDLVAPLSQIEPPEVRTTLGGPDEGNAHWYRSQVLRSAKEARKYVNLNEARYFVKATIRVRRERLVFVTSLHHVGRELSGIMEATAFAQLESVEDTEEPGGVREEFFLCSPEPFVFTSKTRLEQVDAAFRRWLDSALAVAIKEYGDRL